MIILLVISVLFILTGYWLTRSADQLVLKDSLEAYKTMELAVIAGFIGYLMLGAVTLLLYIKT